MLKYNKYLKYKNKYLNLLNLIGGNPSITPTIIPSVSEKLNKFANLLRNNKINDLQNLYNDDINNLMKTYFFVIDNNKQFPINISINDIVIIDKINQYKTYLYIYTIQYNDIKINFRSQFTLTTELLIFILCESIEAELKKHKPESDIIFDYYKC